jgi:hypothetical protein
MASPLIVDACPLLMRARRLRASSSTVTGDLETGERSPPAPAVLIPLRAVSHLRVKRQYQAGVER